MIIPEITSFKDSRLRLKLEEIRGRVLNSFDALKKYAYGEIPYSYGEPIYFPALQIDILCIDDDRHVKKPFDIGVNKDTLTIVHRTVMFTADEDYRLFMLVWGCFRPHVNDNMIADTEAFLILLLKKHGIKNRSAFYNAILDAFLMEQIHPNDERIACIAQYLDNSNYPV